MCVNILPAGLPVHHLHAWYQQKPEALKTLGLEFQTVVSCHVGTDN